MTANLLFNPAFIKDIIPALIFLALGVFAVSLNDGYYAGLLIFAFVFFFVGAIIFAICACGGVRHYLSDFSSLGIWFAVLCVSIVGFETAGFLVAFGIRRFRKI